MGNSINETELLTPKKWSWILTLVNLLLAVRRCMGGGDNVFGHIPVVSVDSACLPDIRLSLYTFHAFCFELASLVQSLLLR